jgi:hypothetical protein
VTYRNNNWYGGPAGSAAGSGDVIANPMLANAGGTRAVDYKLTTGSPNVQKGISVTGVANDYFGTARPALFDIGAHQLSSAAAADTLAPTVPTNVNVIHTTSAMTLTWTASVDNIGVTGYRIYRNSALIATSSTPSYLDGAVTPTGVYSYQVSAVDAAGNESAVTAMAWPSAGAPVVAPASGRGRAAGH